MPSYGGGIFTPEEREYLQSLPAVANVTPRRITYTHEFKRYCMRRYNEGESPVHLFREAGLGPELIGHKRIECCFARWRKSVPRKSKEPNTPPNPFAPLGGVNGKLMSPYTIAAEGNAVPADIRDALIYQQICRIAQLEQRLSKYEDNPLTIDDVLDYDE